MNIGNSTLVLRLGQVDPNADQEQELRQLLGWLRESDLDGLRVNARRRPAAPGDQGALSDALELFLSEGGAAAIGAVSHALWTFLQSRRAKVELTVTGEGTTTVITTSMPRAAVEEVVRQALESGHGRDGGQ